MEINITIDKKRYKFKQLIAMQKGDLQATQEMIAQNMTNPAGEYLKKEAAIEILDELDGEQLDEVVAQFEQALEDVYLNAVPLATKRKSSRR